MNIIRKTEYVTFFHLDMRNFDFEKSHGEPTTSINVQTQILKVNKEEKVTDIKMIFHGIITLDKYTVSANLEQISRITGAAYSSKEEMSGEELQELVKPLIAMLKRLTFEATESAFGEGVELII
ncbi:MAG: DUF1149 family protein [Lactovum sp.]